MLKTHHIDLRLVDGRPEISAAGKFAAADVRWGVQASADLDQWSDAGDTFIEVPSASGLKLLGEPLAPGEDQKLYRIELTLDPGQLAGTSITALTGATKFGISGDAAWSAEPSTGGLRSSGGTASATSRIIAEVSGPAAIDFEMEVAGAGAGDAFVFYIDGIKIAETNGAAVTVRKELSDPGARLLMWEFKRGSGEAVISRSGDF